MNWLWLVVGIVVGGAGQRWLGHLQRRRDRPVDSPVTEPPLSELPLAEPSLAELQMAGSSRAEPSPPEPTSESAQADWLWLSYVRALERAQFQGGFLARAAHELRSPLSSLMGLQQLILADLCDDAAEERQCVAQSYEAAQNLHSLMDQLIGISKLEQGSQRLDIQPLSLDVLIEDVESLVQLQVADRNCRLYLPQPAQPVAAPVYAVADYNSLRQVLVMLIESALSQNASELHLEVNPVGSKAVQDKVLLQLRSDRAPVPLQELKMQLRADCLDKAANPATDPTLDSAAPERLSQLKQSLSQDPEGHFVPHRLSPGMVLLIGQLLLDLNGGTLALAESAGDADSSGGRAAEAIAAEGEIDPAQTDALANAGAVEQGCVLQLWLPKART